MKAAVLVETNKPVEIVNVDLLEPQPNEVMVRITAVAVCHSDLSAQKGDLPVPTPAVLGHEGAGIVEKVGDGVTSLQVGDKVVLTTAGSCGKCRYCWMGRPTLCEVFWERRRSGTMMDGTRRLRRKNGSELNHFFFSSCFAEYSVVHERTAIKVPSNSPLDKVCLFGCGATTGVGAVLNVANVREGSSVAIFGCGGLGLSALLAAKVAGAGNIICVDILDNKLAFARELGGDYSVNASKENPIKRIRELTGGGADYCLEFAGNVDAIAQAVEACRPGGKIVVSGAPPAGSRVNLDWMDLLQEKVLTGATQGASVPGVDIPRYIEMFMAGKLPVDKLVTRTLPLEKINEALGFLERGEPGRSVIVF